MLKSLLTFLLALALPMLADAAETEYASPAAFLKSVPGAKAIESEASGTLAPDDAEYWAGRVYGDTEPNSGSDAGLFRQAFLLKKLGNGKYVLVEKSAKNTSNGGTGHWRLGGVSIAHGSLYIDYGYNWHQCEGSSTSQFKFYDGQFRMVGVKSVETDSLQDLKIYTDTNLLTGRAIVRRVHHGVTRNEMPKGIKAAPLIRDYDGGGRISLYEKHRPMC